MTSEHIEERNGGYYVAGTRISLDSVVYSFKRGNAPEGIQEEYPFLELWQIYGALAFYLKNPEAIDQYLEEKHRKFEASGIPLSIWNPELYARLERARDAMGMKKP
jgi:uncharacterized protein (DUF433 family)